LLNNPGKLNIQKMTLFSYIRKSLFFYRKQHLALFAGTIISAAVLTGALIVGDSVKFSLHKMVNTRLGKTAYALVGGSRFVRSELAGELSSSLKTSANPLLLLQGIAINTQSNERLNKVMIVGIDSGFNKLNSMSLPDFQNDEVVINQRLAAKLKLSVNDGLLVRVESSGLIPINTPMAQEPKPSIAMRLTVKAIATEEQLGNFNLSNDQSEPYNIFVPLSYLSQKLELKNLANVILFAENPDQKIDIQSIDSSMQSVWNIEDMGLSIEYPDSAGTYDLVSNRIFIDEPVSLAIIDAGLPHQNIITYLVNSIRFGTRQTPYSFATASSPALIGDSLKANEIIVNSWVQDDLNLKPGDSVSLDYFVIGNMRELKEASGKFVVKKIIPTGEKGIDGSLMPAFPGLSDAGNCRDWNTGVPIDLKLIRDKDEKYWDDFRGTPKVLLSEQVGRELWSNQFGTLTAVRFNKNQVAPEELMKLLSKKITPAEISLNIVSTKGEGTNAANNSVNFAELFLSLSFFIIVSGILLIVLLFSLHAEKRSNETALLSGLGFNRKTIVSLRFQEALLVIAMGSFFGAILGIAYNYGLIAALNTVWNDAVHSSMLEVYVNPITLLIGAFSTAVIASLSVYLVTRKKLKQPIAETVKSIIHSNKKVINKTDRYYKFAGYASLIAAAILVVISFITSAFNNSALYLSASALFLLGSIILIHGLLGLAGLSAGTTIPGTFQLAFKNLKRNRARSIAVISLLAIGTFTIVLTGSYRKTFFGEANLRSSGTGGYAMWAETASPVSFNLNSPKGKEKLLIEDESELDSVRFIQFLGLEGDDASCLNLNQAQRPGILAVNPVEFDSCGAFSFASLTKNSDKLHPWLELEKRYGDNVYPVFADQTVIQYGLKRKLGDTLLYKNETGEILKLVLVGGLDNSVFQGNILISQKVFKQQFPSIGGTKTMLVDAPANKHNRVTEILQQSLIDYGVEVMATSQRLAAFNSVENTYLSVFMALSGLGLLLGTIGLGIVLLRNLEERKHELALLLTVGYTRKHLFKLVFAENFMLLAMGMVIGIFAAIVGILPSLFSPTFTVQGSFIGILTGIIFLSGALWIYFPLNQALKKPLIQALRKE